MLPGGIMNRKHPCPFGQGCNYIFYRRNDTERAMGSDDYLAAEHELPAGASRNMSETAAAGTIPSGLWEVTITSQPSTNCLSGHPEI